MSQSFREHQRGRWLLFGRVAQWQQCPSSCPSWLTDYSLGFVFLRISSWSITSAAGYFLSHLMHFWVTETWTPRECEAHTFNPRSSEAVSVWRLKAEAHICGCVAEREPERKGAYFSLCQWCPSAYFRTTVSSSDFGNHLLQVLLSQLLRMI